MEISAIRNNLHDRIEHADEQELLKIYGLVLDYENSRVEDMSDWDSLPQWQKDVSEESIKQADAGETIPLETVINNLKQNMA